MTAPGSGRSTAAGLAPAAAGSATSVPPTSVPATARGDLFRALGALAEPPEAAHAGIAAALGLAEPSAADYTAVFLFSAYPYASAYLGAEGLLGGEARDRVAGFWRALGLVPPAEPDHVTALLALYATLIDGEAALASSGDPTAADAPRRARTALLWEHLVSWLPVQLEVVRASGSSAYAAWAELLDAALDEEVTELLPERSLPLPLALREAPGLPAAEESAARWTGAILSPVRSGLAITRADLVRGAAELGLGVRTGERRLMLRSLFEQDSRTTAAWLADEAAAWTARHQARSERHAAIAAFWAERARRTEAALRAAG